MAAAVRPGGSGSPTALKPHALVVADHQRARVFGGEEEAGGGNKVRYTEEQQWKNCVVDLHRVLSICKDLFLILEHNNEALLRVGVELICCEDSCKALWWTEEWFSDDERREWLRQMVAEKLELCMGKGSGGISITREETGDKIDKDVYAAISKKLEQAQEQARIAETAKTAAEMRARETEDNAWEFKTKCANLEKTAQHLREELRNKKPDNTAEHEKIVEQLKQENEQQAKLVEEQRVKAQEKFEKAEAEFKQQVSKAEEEVKVLKVKMEDEMQLKEKKAKELTAELEAVKEQLRKASMAVVEPKKEAPAPVKTDTATEAKMKAMLKKFEAEKARATECEKQVEEAKTTLAKAEDALAEVRKTEIPALQKQQKETEERAVTAEQKAEKLETTLAEAKAESEAKYADYEERLVKAAADAAKAVAAAAKAAAEGKKVEPPPPPPPPKVVEKKKPEPKPVEEPTKEVVVKEVIKEVVKEVVKEVHTGISQEEHDKAVEAFGKAKEKIRRQQEIIAELKEQLEALEGKNVKLLKMLHEIKEQLKKVTELAEKKGCGNIVKSILEESKVSETLEAAEYTCFNRLYDDAKRRQDKLRKLQEERFGLSTPPEEAGRRRSMMRMRGSVTSSALPNPAEQHDQASASFANTIHTAHPSTWEDPRGRPPAQGDPYDYYNASHADYYGGGHQLPQYYHGSPSYGSRDPSLEPRFHEGSRDRSLSPAPMVHHPKEMTASMTGFLSGSGSGPPPFPAGAQLAGGYQQRPTSSGFSATFEQGAHWMSRGQPPAPTSDSAHAGSHSRMARPFGLAASHGSLPTPSTSSHSQLPPEFHISASQSFATGMLPGPSGMASSQWPRTANPSDTGDEHYRQREPMHMNAVYLPGSGLSAMTLDARSGRSPSAEGRPRRRLVQTLQTQSAPKLQSPDELARTVQFNTELPPLRDKKDTDDFFRAKASNTYPSLVSSDVRLMMNLPPQAGPNQDGRVGTPNQRVKTLNAGTQKRRTPRIDWSKDERSLGKLAADGDLPRKGNTFGSGSNIAGWTLHGHGPSKWNENDPAGGARATTPPVATGAVAGEDGVKMFAETLKLGEKMK